MKKWIEKLLTGWVVKFLIKKVDNMKGSWKTTLAGVGALLLILGQVLKVLFDGDPSTTLNLDSIIVEVIAALTAIGLINARDNDKTSEDVGAKK